MPKSDSYTYRELSISVVVPFYNAEGTLSVCIESLVQQSRKPFEIILINNHSTDDSASIAEKYIASYPESQIILQHEPTPGPSAARNKGITTAEGGIIAFTDSDCKADPTWLEQIYSLFVKMDIDGVAGRIIGLNPKSITEKFHARFTMKGSPEPYTHKEFTIIRGGFPTANLAIKSSLLRRINGFDETLEIYSEDYDLCARVYREGGTIHYSPNVVIYHHHRGNLRRTWHQSFGFGKGHAVLLKRHFKSIQILKIPLCPI